MTEVTAITIVVSAFDLWMCIIPSLLIAFSIYTIVITPDDWPDKHPVFCAIVLLLFFFSFPTLIGSSIWNAGWKARDESCPKAADSVPGAWDSANAAGASSPTPSHPPSSSLEQKQ